MALEDSYSSSSSSENSSGGEEEEEEEEEEELFGEDNEEYMLTPAQTTLPPPTLPPPLRPMGNPNHWGNGGYGGRHSNRAMGSRPQSGRCGISARDERCIAEMKLIPNDETLCHTCPPFQEPCEIGCYSRSAVSGIHFDARSLRRFRQGVMREAGADLNVGYDTFVQKREDTDSSGFGDLLAALRNSKISLENIHFVTFRNNLNKILSTAYNKVEAWEMGVHKRKGTVYLDVHKLPERQQNEWQQRACYWGYSFERIATEQTDNAAVDANVEYCALMKTKLGAHRIIMGAEMDCYETSPDGKRHYIELKTSREMNSRMVEKFEREKLLKFWIQSFLAGVPKIVCGFRDDNGIITRAEVMKTRDIPQRVKQKNLWQGGVCLAFADRVLCWLYGTVKESEDYLLRYASRSNRLELLCIDTCPLVVSEHLDILHGQYDV